MADSTALLEQLSANAAGRDIVADGLFDACSHAATFGRKQSATAYTSWTVYGGRWAGLSVENTAVTLTASQTNFIVAHRTTGVVSVATEAANWINFAVYARLYKVECDALGIGTWEDWRFGRGGVFAALVDPNGASGRFEWPVFLGDAATTLTSGTTKAAVRLPFKGILTDVRGSLAVAAGSGPNTQFDINDGGVSILATPLTIDAFEKTSVSAAVPFVFADEAASFAEDSEITIDVDVAGNGAKGPYIVLIGERGWGDPKLDLIASALTLESDPWTDFNADITWTENGAIDASGAQSVNSVYSNYANTSTLLNSATERLTSSTSELFDLSRPFTIDIWFWTSSIANVPHIFEIAHSATNRASLFLDSGAPVLYTQTTAGNGGARITGSAVSTNTWYHARLSFDLTTYRLWINGSSAGTSSTSVRPGGAASVCLGNVNVGASPASTFAWAGHLQRWRFIRGWACTAMNGRPTKPWKTY